MNRSQYGLLIFVALVGGLIGGALSTRLLSGNEVAFAQGETPQIKQKEIYAKTIIAEEYFLHGKKLEGPLDGVIPVPRAILTTEPDGNPKLIMQDSNGKPRFSIQLEDKEGTTLAILNEKGEQRLLLSEKGSYGKDQTGATVAVMDNNGKIRAQIGIQADNNPFLSLSDPSSEKNDTCRNIHLCLEEKDKASISLHGVEGSQRVGLNIDSGGTCLSIKDLKGVTRAELGDTKLAFGTDGTLKKASGNFSVEQRPPSSLILYNEDKKVLWSAP